MTTKSIMTSHLFTLKPDDTVADAIGLMYQKRVHNLPVINKKGQFIGLFGLRRLGHLLLPKAASGLGPHSISNLHFLPDNLIQMDDHWQEIADQPVVNFLEKKKKLMFCSPDTAFPELLALLDQSHDSSLPVLIVEGDSKKLVGMVSPWDVLEGLITGRLINIAEAGESGDEK